MKYAELEAKARDRFPGNGYLLAWNETAGIEISNNIIPLPHGTFVVHAASGRGAWYPQYAPDGKPYMFLSEDEVCDWVWAELNEPPRVPVKRREPSPEERDAQVIRNEELKRKLAEQVKARGAIPYPMPWETARAMRAYFAGGMQAVSDSVTDGQAPALVMAVAQLLAATDEIVIDESLTSDAERFRAAYREISGNNDELETSASVALAERWLSRHPRPAAA